MSQSTNTNSTSTIFQMINVYEIVVEDVFKLHNFIFCDVFSDEISGILKKLSLEKYHPIFEEQEVSVR